MTAYTRIQIEAAKARRAIGKQLGIEPTPLLDEIADSPPPPAAYGSGSSAKQEALLQDAFERGVAAGRAGRHVRHDVGADEDGMQDALRSLREWARQSGLSVVERQAQEGSAGERQSVDERQS